ncbi:MAG: ATP synthase F1 subunit epsilon [Anaerolineae bacterium]|nr:ATP synthase F1 subunit epsilon [Anaerolineae bacterium]
MPIRCEIISQDRIVYQGDADIVILPGEEGEMGILPNHSPLLSVLKFGIITVRFKGDEDHFTVAGGIAEVERDQVVVLADAAENVMEIDARRAGLARKRAEELLKSSKTAEEDPDSYLAMRAALRRSTLRLDAVKRYAKCKVRRNSGS